MESGVTVEHLKRVVRAYGEAIASGDFEAACGHLAPAARGVVRLAAKMDGFETEDCAAALAYLAERDSGVRPWHSDEMAEELTAFVNSLDEVELIDSDRALVRHNDAKATFVREGGAWKVDVGLFGRRDREPDPSRQHHREYVSRRRQGKRR